MDRSYSPFTHSRLVLPRAALGACLRAVMVRRTLGVALNDLQRFNHFPATPLCSLAWWFAGDGELLPPGATASLQVPRQPLPARWLFAGPFTQPVVTWNPGPVHVVMVLLQPDALHRLTGLDVTAWVNRIDDVRAVLPPDWLAMCADVAAAPDDDARIARLQDFLAPRWQAVRPARPMSAQRYLDWVQSLALHAATSAPGRSLRQMERRIKRWAGLPLRELRGIGRSEQAFFHALAAAVEPGGPDWAGIADASGYADQSHLCRETRRLTGFSPEELYRRIAADESFWSYRMWR